jgi:hypothetical protein
MNLSKEVATGYGVVYWSAGAGDVRNVLASDLRISFVIL